MKELNSHLGTLMYTLKCSPIILTAVTMQIFLMTCFFLVASILVFALNPVVEWQCTLPSVNRMQEIPQEEQNQGQIATNSAACRSTECGFITVTNRYHHWSPTTGTHIKANKVAHELTWSENARKAGIGIKAAIKNAVTLLIDVRATLAPVRFKHSPVLSCKNKTKKQQHILKVMWIKQSPANDMVIPQIQHSSNEKLSQGNSKCKCVFKSTSIKNTLRKYTVQEKSR